MTNTKTRVLSAAIIVPVLLVLLYLGGIPWGVLVATAAALGTFEYYEMARARGYKPVAPVGIAASFGFCLALSMKLPLMGMGILFLGVMAVTALDIRRNDPTGSIGNVGASITGIVYVGGLLAHAILLRSYVGGDALGIFLVFAALAGSMLCDTGAYFTGRAYGTKKMIPNISPGKTVQGTIGGILSGIAALCVVTLVGRIFVDVPFTVSEAALLGFFISLGGVIGDLVESMFKRDAGVKDSGNVIPGHGGMMDRLDALLWSVPVTCYFAIWTLKY